MTRTTLLGCGILSSLLYALMNVFIPLEWPGYDAASQVVSELSAIGAPTRPLWLLFAAIYTALLVAFGFGVWQSAGRSRPLRILGALIVAHAIFGLAWPPMHQRDVLAAGGGSLTDTLHIAWTFVTVVCMLLEIGLGAAALGGRFRRYSIVTVVVLVAFGVLTAIDGPRISANLPTPWVGVWERLNIAAFMIWVIVLATMLLRASAAANAVDDKPRVAA